MPNLFRHPTGQVCYFSREILKQVQDDKTLSKLLLTHHHKT